MPAAMADAMADEAAIMPLVSVIVPTIRRPALVLRAIDSVLRQTYPAIEIVVIVDGPDQATGQALAAIGDRRLRVLHNAVAEGPGPARNRAAATARGDWIAFLDDDDEWLPDKLTRQLAGRTPDQDIVLSCRCRVSTPHADYVWPRRLCAPHEPVDDYLFARRSLRRDDAYLATPTIVLPRRLFAASGFGTTPQHEDTTLLLRVTKTLGATLVMLPDTLVVIHTEEARWSAGSVFDWRAALRWGLDMGPLLTPRAFSGFALVTLGSQAADQGDRAGVAALLSAAYRHGAPTPRQLLLFAAFWVVPQGLRRNLRAGLARLRARIRPSPGRAARPAAGGGADASPTTIGTGARC